MYMVTPYMDHDLSGLLENPSVKFTEPQIKCYMLQLFEGIKYLHEARPRSIQQGFKYSNVYTRIKSFIEILKPPISS